MSLRANQYDSLTGSWTPQLYPIQTRIVSVSGELPLTLLQVKDFLRATDGTNTFDDTYDDQYIALINGGATDQVERYIGTDTHLKTRQSYWERVGREVWLPYGPHTSVTSVLSVDEEGVETALTSADYVVIGMDLKKIRFTNFIGPFLKVTYVSGYADNTCPFAISAAILQEVSLQYKNRQDPNTPSRISVNGLSLEARQLLLPYMRHDL